MNHRIFLDFLRFVLSIHLLHPTFLSLSFFPCDLFCICLLHEMFGNLKDYWECFAFFCVLLSSWRWLVIMLALFLIAFGFSKRWCLVGAWLCKLFQVLCLFPAELLSSLSLSFFFLFVIHILVSAAAKAVLEISSLYKSWEMCRSVNFSALTSDYC